MARVIGIHYLELKPGVTAQAFEEFFWKEYLPNIPKFSDTRVSLLKGDKGDHIGKYMMMFEFDSLEARERIFVDEADRTPEVEQVWQNWQKLEEFKATSSWGDFVELSE